MQRYRFLITGAKLAIALLFIFLSPVYVISVYIGMLIISMFIDKRLDNRGRWCLVLAFTAITVWLTEWLYGAFQNRWITLGFIAYLVWMLHRPLYRPAEADNIIEAEVIEE